MRCLGARILKPDCLRSHLGCVTLYRWASYMARVHQWARKSMHVKHLVLDTQRPSEHTTTATGACEGTRSHPPHCLRLLSLRSPFCSIPSCDTYFLSVPPQIQAHPIPEPLYTQVPCPGGLL